MSFTVLVRVQVAMLPVVSVALQVVVVVPTGKNEPESGEQDLVTFGQLSVAVVGPKLITAPH